jgi:hypothetical protein
MGRDSPSKRRFAQMRDDGHRGATQDAIGWTPKGHQMDTKSVFLWTPKWTPSPQLIDF